MRTTVTLADDVAIEVERLRRDRGLGTSAAINELARAGISRPPRDQSYRQRGVHLGLRTDVSNVADVLDALDDDDR
jgi:hypothetical protein